MSMATRGSARCKHSMPWTQEARCSQNPKLVEAALMKERAQTGSPQSQRPLTSGAGAAVSVQWVCASCKTEHHNPLVQRCRNCQQIRPSAPHPPTRSRRTLPPQGVNASAPSQPAQDTGTSPWRTPTQPGPARGTPELPAAQHADTDLPDYNEDEDVDMDPTFTSLRQDGNGVAPDQATVIQDHVKAVSQGAALAAKVINVGIIPGTALWASLKSSVPWLFPDDRVAPTPDGPRRLRAAKAVRLAFAHVEHDQPEVYTELDQWLSSIEHPPVQRSAGQELELAEREIATAQNEIASMPYQLRALDDQVAEFVARIDAQKASLESRRAELNEAIGRAQERRQEALRELTAARTEGPQPGPEQAPPQDAADDASSARRASQFNNMWSLLQQLKELPELAEHAQLQALMRDTPVGSPARSAAGSNVDSVPFSPLDAAERSASEQPEAARSKPQREASQRDGVTKLRKPPNSPVPPRLRPRRRCETVV
jgi:hypothetical protein